MRQTKTVAGGVFLLALTACGAGEPIDNRAVLMTACESSQGIGWNKRNYGDRYCDCWVDQAKEVLSGENYETLVRGAQAEMKAADKADREKIIRQHTEIYSTVSGAAKRCAKKAR
jgi:hypothetical protein